MIALGGRGGTGYTAFRLAKLLHEKGHYVKLAVWDNSMIHKWAEENGIPYTTEFSMRPKFSPFSFLVDIIKLKKMLEKENFEIVHVYRSPDYWRAAIAVKLAKNKPKLIRSRSIVVPIRDHFFNRILHNKFTDKVIATASLIVENYKKAKGFDTDKVILFLDGVNCHRFNPSNKSNFLREKYNITEDKIIVGTVARFARVKGYKYLLEAIKGLKDYPVHFVLIGIKKDENILNSLLNSKLENITVITEKIKDIEKYYGGMDVYLLSSIGSEGSSRATLEAMATGLPVIATSVGVLPDIVKNEKNGFLIKPADSEEIKRAVLKFIKNPELIEKMGKESRKIIESEFCEEIIVKKLEKIYEEVLKI